MFDEYKKIKREMQEKIDNITKEMQQKIDYLTATNTFLQNIVDAKVAEALRDLEELDQNKTYVLFVEEKDRIATGNILRLAKGNSRWTLPQIIVSTAPIENYENIIERVASVVHDEWIDWSNIINMEEDISPGRVDCWRKYWIPYDKLPEEIKEIDRIYARKAVDAVIIGEL